jgi:hypothetical protein
MDVAVAGERLAVRGWKEWPAKEKFQGARVGRKTHLPPKLAKPLTARSDVPLANCDLRARLLAGGRALAIFQACYLS